MDIGKEAFCDYIEQYQRRMFRVARGILYHDEDAEDAVGESILKAYEKRNQLKNPDKFRPWIMKIVVHESYRIARKRGRTDYLEDSPGTEIPTEDSHYELWDLVNTLDEEFRVVTILFYYELKGDRYDPGHSRWNCEITSDQGQGEVKTPYLRKERFSCRII